MFDKYATFLESIALSKKRVRNEISLMESLKKYMTAVFFLYRTFSYRYTIESGDSIEHSLIALQRSSKYRKTATEYFYRLTFLYALYLMKSTVIEEQNGFIRKKTDSYKQYAFELCIAVFSICDMLNEGLDDYGEWSSTYKSASLLTIRRVLDATISQNTPSDVFKRLDRAIQELDGFDKAKMQQYINDNVAILSDDNLVYPKGNYLWTELFGYVYLKRRDTKTALPLTIACEYNKKWQEYCPNYLFLYETERILPIKP